MSKYIVLRDVGTAKTNEPFTAPGPLTKSMETKAAPSPRIDVESLQPHQIDAMSCDPSVHGIARAMPISLVRAFEAPVATADDNWGIDAVGAVASPFDGAGVVPCVLDTGIRADHAAFNGVTIVARDFTGAGDGDGNGHGTHCAGTIFGRDVGGRRIGVARGVERALVGKVLDSSGRGDTAMLFEAIQWAINNRANVISMSLGFDFPGLVNELVADGWPIELATSAALEAYRANLGVFNALMAMNMAQIPLGGGAVVVAAAGNESRRDDDPRFKIAASLPSAAEGVVSVAALAKGADDFVVAGFSNIFAQVSAPGAGIISADASSKTGLRKMSGTSMACPHVAGVAALWWQSIRNSAVDANATRVIAKLLATARTNPINSAFDTADRGAGIVTAPSA